jgi:ATP-dependent Clp protease ATP-binding subunit ClpA
VIDEAGAAQMLLPEGKRKKVIGVKEIEAWSPRWPASRPRSVSKDDAEVLRNLRRDLKRVVFGQDKAIEALSSAIKLARAGLREPEKPIGNYLFSGPTGVGKTEVAKQLAVAGRRAAALRHVGIHGAPHRLRLIGAPPGYVGFDQGGLLTDGVDQHPHCVLLLDEIEKAHPDVQHPVAGDGPRQADRPQRQVGRLPQRHPDHDDQRRRADMAKAAIGFGRASARARIGGDQADCSRRSSATAWTRSSPSPRCRRRSSQVVEKFVLQLEAQLADRNVTIELSPEAADWLATRAMTTRWARGRWPG